jgi:hypothetical protein
MTANGCKMMANGCEMMANGSEMMANGYETTEYGCEVTLAKSRMRERIRTTEQLPREASEEKEPKKQILGLACIRNRLNRQCIPPQFPQANPQNMAAKNGGRNSLL